MTTDSKHSHILHKVRSSDETKISISIPVIPQRKDVAFETVKSAGIGAVVGAGLTYGLFTVMNRIVNGSWSVSSATGLFTIACGIGALSGVLFGYDANRNYTYLNDRFDFLDKHKNNKSAADIVINALNKHENEIQKSTTEKLLGNLNTMFLFGSLLEPIRNDSSSIMHKISYLDGRTNHNIFTVGFYLSLAGELCARAVNKENWINTQRKDFSHAESLIYEREIAANHDRKK